MANEVFVSLGRTPREEEDSQGPCEEADYIYEAVCECYDDGWEEEGTSFDFFLSLLPCFRKEK